MDRITRIAVIAACVAVTVDAIAVTAFVVTRTVQDRSIVGPADSADPTPTDPKVAASGSSKMEEACEAAQLKLLKGEVTDSGQHLDLTADITRYCKDKTTP